MILPNGCKCGPLTVYPPNWQEPDASIKKPWYISYRFYDSSGKVKQVALRGMNSAKTLKKRRDKTDYLLRKEEADLKQGANPLTKKLFVGSPDYIIDPRTPIIQALEKALERVKTEHRTRIEIGSILKHVNKAAKASGLLIMQIRDVKKRHIKMLLEEVGRQKLEDAARWEKLKKPKTRKPQWTANNYNHYRKYLSLLFRELSDIEAIEFNPIREIGKQKTIQRIRTILTKDERETIDEHLKKNYYRFWLFMQIFFHSGSRETELLKVKGKDVNLKKQAVKVTIIKGSQQREVIKTIKDIALPFWLEAMEGCREDDFVFSKGLRPGGTMIRPEQISRRWRLHVKEKLGIQADMYSLKHLHTDEVASLLSLDAAGKHNSHTSNKTTLIYAVNEKEREAERLKKVGNKFA